MGNVGNLSLVGLCYFQDVCHFEILLTFSAKLLLYSIFLSAFNKSCLSTWYF
jgi:hypothetical protein